MALVFSIYNFFNTKTSLANKWMRKKLPSCSNSALANYKYSMFQEMLLIFNETEKRKATIKENVQHFQFDNYCINFFFNNTYTYRLYIIYWNMTMLFITTGYLKSQYISSPEQNYFLLFAMRYSCINVLYNISAT